MPTAAPSVQPLIKADLACHVYYTHERDCATTLVALRSKSQEPELGVHC